MHSAETTQPKLELSDLKYRWVMLAGVWLVYSCYGLVSSSIAPLIGPVSEDLHLSRSAMGSVLGAWPLVYLVAAVPAGALVDRWGLPRSLAVGTFLIALSGVLRSLAVDYTSLFLAVAVFGIGGPLISVGAPKLARVWFNEKERGMALGIYITGMAVGNIAALSTANSVFMPLTGSNWRFTLLIYAAMALVVGMIWLLIARHRGSPKGKTSESATAAFDWKVYPLLLRIRVVQIILLMSLGAFFFNHGLNNWLPEILRSGGMSAARAGFWAALPTMVGIAGALTIPRLATPARRIRMLVFLFLAAGVAVLFIGITEGQPLIFGLVLLGAVRTSMMPITMVILMDDPQVGSRNMGAAGGLYFTAGEMGGMLGPLLIGITADLTGGFLGGLLMLAGLSAVLAALSIGLRFALRGQGRSLETLASAE